MPLVSSSRRSPSLPRRHSPSLSKHNIMGFGIDSNSRRASMGARAESSLRSGRVSEFGIFRPLNRSNAVDKERSPTGSPTVMRSPPSPSHSLSSSGQVSPWIRSALADQLSKLSGDFEKTSRKKEPRQRYGKSAFSDGDMTERSDTESVFGMEVATPEATFQHEGINFDDLQSSHRGDLVVTVVAESAQGLVIPQSLIHSLPLTSEVSAPLKSMLLCYCILTVGAEHVSSSLHRATDDTELNTGRGNFASVTFGESFDFVVASYPRMMDMAVYMRLSDDGERDMNSGPARRMRGDSLVGCYVIDFDVLTDVRRGEVLARTYTLLDDKMKNEIGGTISISMRRTVPKPVSSHVNERDKRVVNHRNNDDGRGRRSKSTPSRPDVASKAHASPSLPVAVPTVKADAAMVRGSVLDNSEGVYRLPISPSALCLAVIQGDEECVRQLLENGSISSRIDEYEDNGTTVLHAAAAYGYTHLCYLLVSYGSSPNKVSRPMTEQSKAGRWTAREWALRGGHYRTAKVLAKLSNSDDSHHDGETTESQKTLKQSNRSPHAIPPIEASPVPQDPVLGGSSKATTYSAGRPPRGLLPTTIETIPLELKFDPFLCFEYPGVSKLFRHYRKPLRQIFNHYSKMDSVLNASPVMLSSPNATSWQARRESLKSMSVEELWRFAMDFDISPKMLSYREIVSIYAVVTELASIFNDRDGERVASLSGLSPRGFLVSLFTIAVASFAALFESPFGVSVALFDFMDSSKGLERLFSGNATSRASLYITRGVFKVSPDLLVDLHDLESKARSAAGYSTTSLTEGVPHKAHNDHCSPQSAVLRMVSKSIHSDNSGDKELCNMQVSEEMTYSSPSPAIESMLNTMRNEDSESPNNSKFIRHPRSPPHSIQAAIVAGVGGLPSAVATPQVVISPSSRSPLMKASISSHIHVLSECDQLTPLPSTTHITNSRDTIDTSYVSSDGRKNHTHMKKVTHNQSNFENITSTDRETAHDPIATTPISEQKADLERRVYVAEGQVRRLEGELRKERAARRRCTLLLNDLVQLMDTSHTDFKSLLLEAVQAMAEKPSLPN